MKDIKIEVEELGVFYENSGMPPMQARVFALLLLLSDPPYLDFYSIKEFLGASKSSISNALNRLIDAKRIGYLTQPGDRKRYFKVDPEKWLEQMKVELASTGPLVEILDRIISKRTGMDSPEFNNELKRVRAFFSFITSEFPGLIDKWERIDAELALEET